MNSSIIHRREWRTVIFIALALVVFTSIPYLIGVSVSDNQVRFGGALLGAEDMNSYLAKMREGANGAWLFTMIYTSEPHNGVLFFLPYLLLGKVAALVMPPDRPEHTEVLILTYHVARVILDFLLILVMYRFIAEFLRSRRLRRTALILACLGGGLGWLLILLGKGEWFGSAPVDFYLPEGYSFYVLYGLPHLALARIGFIGGLLLTMRSLQQTERRIWLQSMLGAGLCWLVMGLCVPFYVGVLMAVLGAWGLMLWIIGRRFPMELFVRALVGGILPGIYLGYVLLTMYASSDPTWRQFNSQNSLPSPHPLHYVAGYGLYVLLVCGVLVWLRKARPKTFWRFALPLSWLAIAPLLAYMPISIQRRMLEGVFLPLCILAVLGLRCLWTTWRRQRWVLLSRMRWALAVLVVTALAIGSPLMVVISGSFGVLAHSPDSLLFHSVDEITALDWLNTHVPGGAVVLTNYSPTQPTGNYLPARANIRVVMGHSVETLYQAEKAPQVERFYSGGMSEAEALAFLSRYHIQYVYVSPSDRTPGEKPYLTTVYSNRGYVIYQVNGR